MNENHNLLDAYQTFLTAASGLDTKFASHPVIDLLAYVPSRASLADLGSIETQFRSENPSLSPCNGPYIALLPASLAKDSEYLSTTYCTDPFPAGQTVFDVIVSAIRSGALDLSPDDDSGWYDYQLYALETLLVPEKGFEKDHLFLTAKYKKKLIESFKTMITQIRETHYKGLNVATGTAAPMPKYEVYPKLPVEPFPTYYLRTARAYRFLDTMLQALLGQDVLSDIQVLGPDGADTNISLQTRLQEVTKLMYGFYAVAARSLGMDPRSYLLEGEAEQYPMADCEQAARDWIADWTNNEEVLADNRIAVPVAYDQTTDEVVYWAVAGVKVVESRAEFYEGFEPKVIQAVQTDGNGECDFEGFTDRGYLLLMEPTVEFRRPASASPLTRDEVRSICDAHDKLEDIKTALEETR